MGWERGGGMGKRGYKGGGGGKEWRRGGGRKRVKG